MNAKTYNDADLGVFEFRRAWVGKCSVEWGGRKVHIKMRMISSENEVITKFQRDAAVSFAKAPADTFTKCRSALLSYCQRIYGPAFDGNAIESQLTPCVILFERQKEYGILFKCVLEDEVNLAVKFSGEGIEVGTDDILL